MRRLFSAAVFLLTACLVVLPPADAAAQRRSPDLSASLERLQNNPRYRGQIIGTQIRRTERGAVYEVQILRPDDRVIVVYIDPLTGGVVGDSQRRGGGRDDDDDGQRGRGRR